MPVVQDLVSNSSRPIAEACNSAGEGFSASPQPELHRGYLRSGVVGDSQTTHASVAQLGKVTLHSRSSVAQSKQPVVASTTAVHAQPLGKNNTESYVGRATKLTAANGPPGQITLVRSPTAVKRTTVQLTEPQQQQLQQQRQQQRPQPQQQQQQPHSEQQQQSTMKGHRLQRARKTKVPAVPAVIADPMDVAREVQNAVDMSDNQDSDISHRDTNDDEAGAVLLIAP